MGNKVRAAHSVVQAQLEAKTLEAQNLLAEVQALRAQVAEKLTLLATVEANNANLKEQLTVQKSEVEELQKKLTVEFENIANKILKERAAELSASSEKNIGAILNPLGDKIADFKKQVEEAFNTEMRDKMSLKEQLKTLTEQNTRISDEANNLTKALKGDVKKQGNWGEIILERVLETSGLTKGLEYEREKVVEGVQGETYRPDVIVNLPDNKNKSLLKDLNKENITVYLSIFVTILLTLFIIILLFVNIPQNNKDLVTQLMLTLVGGWGGMMGYYFSSTATSKEKDARLERMQKNILDKK